MYENMSRVKDIPWTNKLEPRVARVGMVSQTIARLRAARTSIPAPRRLFTPTEPAAFELLVGAGALEELPVEEAAGEPEEPEEPALLALGDGEELLEVADGTVDVEEGNTPTASQSWVEIASAVARSAASQFCSKHAVVALMYGALVQKQWLSLDAQPKVFGGFSTQVSAQVGKVCCLA